MPTIEEFAAYIKALSQHDWYFDYSDDPSVYRVGKAKHSRLLTTAMAHEVYGGAYQAYYANTFSGQDFSEAQRDRAIEQLRIKVLFVYPVAA